jgi:serine protease Do
LIQEVIGMVRFLSSVTIFAAALGAPLLVAQQMEVQLAPSDSNTPQIFEFHNGGMLSGGTYLGVNLCEIPSDRARELKLKEAYGVEITRVEDGSPAEKAGLKSADVVLEYNGQRVEGMEQFGRLVRETPSGREVKLLISRNGATQSITATLQTRKLKTMATVMPNFDMPEIHIPDMPQVFTTWRNPMLGVEAESLGPQLAAYFGVKEGVLVRSVSKDTAAEKAGIKAGDVITKVAESSVTTPNELVSAVHAAMAKKSFPIELVRDRHETNVTVIIEDRSEKVAPSTRAVHNVKM